ncbi:MFS transporter [Vitiosangium sp. GDMCC 1.1324]|uniref:MFS transporter n=1 Tax=Vitiosangium sp. (strain GDMCC 1.1324) TaxID=2138576 RepID=UPI000D33B439|nr:MFS transporter [Vitiosangium sp. GDMCC 1.1324]PTL74977.1 MFS transporter [Vitiosangium sp. GDMCC 1.1324]
MSTPEPRASSNPLRAFLVTWVGQLLSLIGSGLTSFALGIEVYKRTGSITKLSLVTFFSIIPFVLVAPFAGALVDRWNRRTVMLISDLGAGICSFLIWCLVAAGEKGFWPLETWHFYLPFGLSGLFAAFRAPALSAATSQLVPKQHLGRANGMIEMAGASSQLISPVLAGALVVHIGLQGIILIDLTTFVFAFGSLLFVRIPSLPRSAESAARKSLRQEVAYGWSFIRTRPGLVGLLVSSTVTNVVLGMVVVLITPLVLSFGDAATLGLILSLAGVGMLLGSIAMSIWGGPKRLVRGALALQLVASLVLFGGALPASTPVVALCAGMFLFTIPLITGTLQSIWQRKVPQEVQGRVFSTKRMIVLAMSPVSSLLSGPLADKLFEPWLAPGGALASSVGLIVGTGKGRGIGFLFVVLGCVMAVNVLITWLSPRVRHIETELPDALPDKPQGNVTRLPETPATEAEPSLPAASGGSQS